jgi:hypothetical protein
MGTVHALRSCGKPRGRLSWFAQTGGTVVLVRSLLERRYLTGALWLAEIGGRLFPEQVVEIALASRSVWA